METSETSRAVLCDLARQMSEASDMETRMRIFARFRDQVLTHVRFARDRSEAASISIYLDRLERLSPDSEVWRDIFSALQKTISDERGETRIYELG